MRRGGRRDAPASISGRNRKRYWQQFCQLEQNPVADAAGFAIFPSCVALALYRSCDIQPTLVQLANRSSRRNIADAKAGPVFGAKPSRPAQITRPEKCG
jgi:hypothetical protein